MNRLKEKYIKIVAPKLAKDLKLSNVMKVPRIDKVCVNSGIGSFRDNREMVESFIEELTSITGQKPYPRSAKAAEAGFKIRKGDVVAYAVTLRGEKMWAFLDKFINVALPRVRDFRGLSDMSFDEVGNYSAGIREHVIFPEVNPNSTKGIRGLQVTVTFSSKDSDVNRQLLKELGFPFRKQE